MAEQFIGQHLLYFRGLSDPPELCYWLRQQKSANAEVDYVISRGDLITPVEVKAGKNGTLKSMLQFVYSKNARVSVRFDLNPPSIQKVKHFCKADANFLIIKRNIILEASRFRF